MGPSVCHAEGLIVKKSEPLQLRYLLLVHAAEWNAERVKTIQQDWQGRPAMTVRKSTKPHHQFEIVAAS
jgi:hypothetical protein